jgi:glucose/arabinose dehydrogenase
MSKLFFQTVEIKLNEPYSPQDAKPAILGGKFDGGITDLQVGPDGYLYILTFAGAIYKIVPTSSS